MAKKKEVQLDANIVTELVETIEDVKPITLVEQQPTIQNGYIRIRRKGKEGNGIIISVRLWGVKFNSDEWDLMEEFKKK